MAVSIAITTGFKDPNYFDNLNPQSAYMYSGGGQTQVIPAHNQLTGLQGGATGEYYHFNTAEHQELSAWLSQMSYNSAADQVENITLYGEIYLNNNVGVSHESRYIYWGDTGDVDTYIHEFTDDVLRLVCGDGLVMTWDVTDVLVSVDLNVAGEITVDTINEYSADTGVTVDSLLIKDQNIGTSSLYQGVAYLTGWELRDEATDINNFVRLYSNTAGDTWQQYVYRFGGTIASPAATPTDASLREVLGYAYDGGASRPITRHVTKIDGAVASDNVAGKYQWYVRPSGAGASLTLEMSLDGSGLTLSSGATVDTIETTLTDDATHIPTSSAVYNAISVEDIWDRSSAGLISPANSGDDLEIDGGILTVNTINEYVSEVGVTIDSLLIKDGNIGESTDYQGVAYLTGWQLRADTNVSTYIFVYTDTAGSCWQDYNYRYGGTIAVPSVAPSGAYIKHLRGFIYDGTAAREVTRFSSKALGVVATDNVAGQFYWLIRPTGVGESIGIVMELNEDGLKVDVINEYTTNAGVTIDGGLLENNVVGGTVNYWDNAYIRSFNILHAGGSTASQISADASDNLIVTGGGVGAVIIEGIALVSSYFIIPEVTTPAGTPAADEGYLFMDSADDHLKFKNSSTTYDLTTGGGDVSVSGTPVNNQIAIWTDATTIEGETGLTWSGTILDTTGTIQVDIINEHTSSMGVTIDGVFIKDTTIGIGTIDPQEQLDVRGGSGSVGTLLLGRSHATVIGGGFGLGLIKFGGEDVDGTFSNWNTANISAVADSTWTNATDTPTRLTFYTTPDASGTAVERMQVKADGDVSIFNTLLVDTINEYTGSAGVTIESVVFEDGGITLVAGATVDNIETTLTDDDTHIPTSGAVIDAIDAVTGVQIFGTPVNNQLAVWTNATTIEGDAGLTWSGTVLDTMGTLQVDIINEHTGATGVTIEGVLLKDTSYSMSADSSISKYVYVYSNTDTQTDNNFTYRYGGTIASPVAAPTGAYIQHINRSYVYDGTANREVARITTRINGSVATDNVAGIMYWLIRESGVSGSLAARMTLSGNGLSLESGATVDTIETTLTNDDTHIPTSGAVYDAIGTPAALTKTDDTNVTLTLGGTPATALLQATSLTLGWTGTLADGRITSAGTWNAKQTGHANLTSFSGLTYVSTAFVKMTGVNTFSLDTTSYGTSNVSVANQGNERIVTCTSSGDALNAESALQFTGTILTLTGTLSINDTNTQIWEDGSSNLTFKDAVTGPKTLAQLAAGGGGISFGSGDTDNYVLTSTGVGDQIQGEANLTFSGSALVIAATTSFGGHSYPTLNSQYTLGTSSLYWTATYTDQVTLASGIVIGYSGSDMTFVDGVTSSKTLAQLATGGSPGGSDTHIQFNDASAFGGNANFTWNDYTVRGIQTVAHAAWSDFPTSLPSIYTFYAVRGSSSYGVNNYNGVLLNAKGSSGNNAYAYLGVEALSAANHTSRFNLLLRGSASTDYETVFSADYNSTYYWKAGSDATDITHLFIQDSGTPDTRAVMGWDDSALGFQIETGTGFSATPAIYIGYTNDHVCIGGQTDSAAYELLVLGTDVAVRFESTTGNAELQIMGNDSGDDASITLAYPGATGATILWQGSSGDSLYLKNGIYTGIEITTVGRVHMPNLQNVTNTNYVRYNSSSGECTWLSSSDIRLKENIKLWQPDSLKFLLNQNLILFDRKDKSSMCEVGWDGTQMEQLMLDMTWRDDKDYVNIKDAHMPFHFHRAIQQLGEKQETNEQKIIRLEKRVKFLESSINNN